MLPEPTSSLTIPSIHDGTTLDCRIYHPASLAVNPRAPPWKRHAVVFAHPYGPLGGSYDDPLLDAVATQLLRMGYLVGTFNFRGAGNSAGRTSWTAKPERDDYISFVGFMVYYVHHLDPFQNPAATQLETPRESHMAETSLPSALQQQPVLIMAGYSYGAMVTTQLPPLGELLAPFKTPESASDIAHIRIRAESLAKQQNLILHEARSVMMHQRVSSNPLRHGVRIGGGDGAASPRKSHDSQGRRSFSLDDAEEKLRRGVHDILAKTKHGRKRSDLSGTLQAEKPKSTPPANGKLPQVENLLIPRPAYLLVSPLQGVITHLATMSIVPSAFTRNRSATDTGAEAKLVQNPTLAVHGDSDVFVAVAKLRAWTERLSSQPGSQFRGHEIESAGHFWAEEGVLHRMLDLVCEFAGELLGED